MIILILLSIFIFLSICSTIFCVFFNEKYVGFTILFIFLSCVLVFCLPKDEQKMSDREKVEKTIIRKDACYRQYHFSHTVGFIEVDCLTGKDKIGD
jgi:hypothetical protein